MTPGKQIYISASTLITGVLLQIIASLRASASESMLGSVSNDALGGHAAEHMDSLLEQVHMQMLWTFVAFTASWIFLMVGAAIVIWGIYRHFAAKRRTSGLRAPTTNT